MQHVSFAHRAPVPRPTAINNRSSSYALQVGKEPTRLPGHRLKASVSQKCRHLNLASQSGDARNPHSEGRSACPQETHWPKVQRRQLLLLSQTAAITTIATGAQAKEPGAPSEEEAKALEQSFAQGFGGGTAPDLEELDKILNPENETAYKDSKNGFSFEIPEGYEQVDVSELTANPSTLPPQLLTTKAPPPSALKVRYASKAGTSRVGVAVRSSSEIQPTFFQVTDIAQLGSLKDAAGLLCPPGSTITAAKELTHVSPSDKVDRTYYLYKIKSEGLRGYIASAAKQGKIYVMLASQDVVDDDVDLKLLKGSIDSFLVT